MKGPLPENDLSIDFNIKVAGQEHHAPKYDDNGIASDSFIVATRCMHRFQDKIVAFHPQDYPEDFVFAEPYPIIYADVDKPAINARKYTGVRNVDIRGIIPYIRSLTFEYMDLHTLYTYLEKNDRNSDYGINTVPTFNDLVRDIAAAIVDHREVPSGYVTVDGAIGVYHRYGFLICFQDDVEIPF